MNPYVRRPAGGPAPHHGREGQVSAGGDLGGHVYQLAVPPASQPNLVHQRRTGK